MLREHLVDWHDGNEFSQRDGEVHALKGLSGKQVMLIDSYALILGGSPSAQKKATAGSTPSSSLAYG